jgi:hypothetical protein
MIANIRWNSVTLISVSLESVQNPSIFMQFSVFSHSIKTHGLPTAYIGYWNIMEDNY